MIGIYSNTISAQKARILSDATDVKIISDFGGLDAELDLIYVHLTDSPIDLEFIFRKFDQYTLQRVLIICHDNMNEWKHGEVDVKVFDARVEGAFEKAVEAINAFKKESEIGENTKI